MGSVVWDNEFAEVYDTVYAREADRAVVDPIIDFLADLAGDGPALEFGSGSILYARAAEGGRALTRRPMAKCAWVGHGVDAVIRSLLGWPTVICIGEADRADHVSATRTYAGIHAAVRISYGTTRPCAHSRAGPGAGGPVVRGAPRFEPVAAYDFWATGFEGGPLQISADGGKTMLALFEVSEGHPMVPQQTGVAFSVDADSFMSFARSLPRGIHNPRGEPFTLADLVDFDLCWAFDLVDPWRNQYELNCYDYDRVRAELVEADAVETVRYWSHDLYTAYLDSSSS